MIHFVLHDAGVEIAHLTVDRSAELVETAIAQTFVARHQAAHAGHRQAAFPALFLFVIEHGELGIDQHGERHRLGIGIARIAFDAEDDDALQFADLRRREAGAIGREHGLAHVGDQREFYKCRPGSFCSCRTRTMKMVEGVIDRYIPTIGISHV